MNLLIDAPSNGLDADAHVHSSSPRKARASSMVKRESSTSVAFPVRTAALSGQSRDPLHVEHALSLMKRAYQRRARSLFVREKNRIVSRRRLLHDVWGYENPERVETRTVDMHIVKLRKKLATHSGDDANSKASPIETVRGEGYRYSE